MIGGMLITNNWKELFYRKMEVIIVYKLVEHWQQLTSLNAPRIAQWLREKQRQAVFLVFPLLYAAS